MATAHRDWLGLKKELPRRRQSYCGPLQRAVGLQIAQNLEELRSEAAPCFDCSHTHAEPFAGRVALVFVLFALTGGLSIQLG